MQFVEKEGLQNPPGGTVNGRRLTFLSASRKVFLFLAEGAVMGERRDCFQVDHSQTSLRLRRLTV